MLYYRSKYMFLNKSLTYRRRKKRIDIPTSEDVRHAPKRHFQLYPILVSKWCFLLWLTSNSSSLFVINTLTLKEWFKRSSKTLLAMRLTTNKNLEPS